METKHIHIKDYNYALPDERIAKFPLAQRDHSKLLLYKHGEVSEDTFCNIANHLPEGALMVFNNTRVIQARMHFRKATGALIEVFLLEPYSPADYEQMFQTRGECEWLCMIGNLKKWKGEVLQRTFDVNSESVTLKAERLEDVGKSNAAPPYLNRETQESDKTTYQTVYSKVKGSVAAPTAGLHFTPEVLAAIDRRGIDREELTLHVGAGTFKPVKSEEIQDHEMHTEYVCVHRETLEKLIKHGAEAIAVGTTSVRTLESLYYMGVKLEQNMDLSEEELHVNQWEPYENEAAKGVTPMKALENILAYLDKHGLRALHSSTQIIIAPGYEYKIVKMINAAFQKQTAIPKNKAKERLQEIYDTLGLQRKAKATDLAQ